jgi:hypothetical protein
VGCTRVGRWPKALFALHCLHTEALFAVHALGHLLYTPWAICFTLSVLIHTEALFAVHALGLLWACFTLLALHCLLYTACFTLLALDWSGVVQVGAGVGHVPRHGLDARHGLSLGQQGGTRGLGWECTTPDKCRSARVL